MGRVQAAGLACSLKEAKEESFQFRCGKCRRVEVLEAQLAALKIELEEARDSFRAAAGVREQMQDRVEQVEGEQDGRRGEDEGRQRVGVGGPSVRGEQDGGRGQEGGEDEGRQRVTGTSGRGIRKDLERQ